jgi:hypothetical protein
MMMMMVVTSHTSSLLPCDSVNLYKSTIITVLDIIYRPVLYLKTTFRRLDSVSVVIWARSIMLVHISGVEISNRHAFQCIMPDGL